MSYVKLHSLGREYRNIKTDNSFHLLLSIFTLGFWSVVWIFVAIRNTFKRKRISKRIDNILFDMPNEEKIK